MANPPSLDKIKIGIVGLGYVGLPLAVYLSRHFTVVGFDLDQARVEELSRGHDRTHEVTAEELSGAKHVSYTATAEELRGCNFHIVTVPTPVDRAKRPDLGALISASRTVGSILSPGDIVVYKSTVYPGATEEVCVPALANASGLTFNRDFFVGYSPERVNPGDQQHRLPTIMKVTSGSTPEIAEIVNAVYGKVITAGTHCASSIRVAEAAKVIENIQRDVNIALINELAMLFKELGLETGEVLEAAGTKWNFLPFRPGLVGGHCVGVDPYYLTHKAEINRLPSADDPRGTPHQRRHGGLSGERHHQDDAQASTEHRRSTRAHHGLHLQGELSGHAQHQGRRSRHFARRLRQ